MSFLLTLVTGFASGIFFRSMYVFGWEVVAGAVTVGMIFYIANYVRPRHAYILVWIFCMMFALGVVRSTIADTPLPATFASQLGHKVTYEGVVVSDPSVREKNQRVEIEVDNGTESTIVLAVARLEPVLAVGDRVRVSGTLSLPKAFDTDGGRTFQYDKYLQRDGVRFMFSFAFVNVIEHASWHSVPAALARIKHAFLDGLSATMPNPYAALAGGVVIGGKTGLGADLQDAFVRSGLVQIIVLSGYNVMIVAEWIMAGVALTKLSRWWSSGAGALAIIIFVGIAGTTATAMRAALMALIALYARATGRTYTAGRALLLVVLLMLVWNPLYLVFDPGFGLSVAATSGLIWLAPIIEARLIRIKKPFWKNAIATTLSAQIAVLPLLLYDTGNLSIVAIPANLLTMPIMPAAMALSVVAGFAGMLFGSLAPVVGTLLAYPAYLANAYIIYVATSSAALPFASFIVPLFPFVFVVLSYAALIAIAVSKRFSTTPQLMLAKKASM